MWFYYSGSIWAREGQKPPWNSFYTSDWSILWIQFSSDLEFWLWTSRENEKGTGQTNWGLKQSVKLPIFSNLTVWRVMTMDHGELNSTGIPELNPYVADFSNLVAGITQWVKISLFHKWFQNLWVSTMKEWSHIAFLHHIQKWAKQELVA